MCVGSKKGVCWGVASEGCAKANLFGRKAAALDVAATQEELACCVVLNDLVLKPWRREMQLK